ncbi:MAG: T9SS type A sorting domain-containing protein, partial [Candidatus Cloacimonadaceae bacterium]|nr:T9SS type A sorting domain-containing protein [Candidatus Cloacimonadaceae bacterium]
ALDLGRSFENSPVVERRNGEIKLFSLEIPYPEYAQDQYAMPDDPDALTDHQIFIGNDISTNDTPMPWFGIHVFDGIVRANSDIRIKQAGGGTNNGWPTFNAQVIIGGEVISMSGPYPHDEIFRGGLIEHAPAMRSNLYYGRNSNNFVGPTNYDPNRIIFVQVDHSGYTAMMGVLSNPQPVFADVYDPYPPSDPENYQFRNNYTIRDTIWTFLGSGSCSNRINFVNSKLWIKGTFGSHQVWAAADTISIIGDILLSGTPAGSSPHLNWMDSVGLFSEKSVIMKYGYNNPYGPPMRYHLARPDTAPFMIYADIFAIGQGNGNPRRDGTFSFEYQHPHPSVPAYQIGDIVYDNIDLHRRRYPQDATNPWPPEIDYPWYNPLWPERTPYLERGKIWMWGSVNQTRHGFLHRSLYDVEHPSNGIWDQTQDYCGGSSAVSYTDPVLGIQMQTTNYPGASGNGVGYKASYFHNPARKLPFFYPYTYYPNLGKSPWLLGLYVGSAEMPMEDTYYYIPNSGRTRSKSHARQADRAAYALNDLLMLRQGNVRTDLSQHTSGDGDIVSLALDASGDILLGQIAPQGDAYLLNIKQISTQQPVTVSETSFPAGSQMNDVAILPDGRKLLARAESGYLRIYEIYPDLELTLLDSAQIPQGGDPEISRVFVVPSSSDGAELYLQLKAPGSDHGSIYHARFNTSTPNSDPSTPALIRPTLSAYPNPARSQLKIEIDLPAKTRHRLEIYNLKGQKVRSLTDAQSLDNNKLEYTWNGNDDQGRRAGSGIYFLRLIVGDKAVLSKKICWM